MALPLLICFFEGHNHSFCGSLINLNTELTKHNLCPRVCLYQIAFSHKSMFYLENDFDETHNFVKQTQCWYQMACLLWILIHQNSYMCLEIYSWIQRNYLDFNFSLYRFISFSLWFVSYIWLIFLALDLQYNC